METECVDMKLRASVETECVDMKLRASVETECVDVKKNGSRWPGEPNTPVIIGSCFLLVILCVSSICSPAYIESVGDEMNLKKLIKALID